MFLLSIKNVLIASACLLSLLAVPGNAQGQSVRAQLSAREVWVGMPVILQLQITDAADYQAPQTPVIDGCRVEAAGAPAQSSQITIINGRRSEIRSITMQYLITPQRPGSFEVPSLELQVNGRNERTRPLSFAAVQSETGDLLFAEIEGGKESVFVGQPLDLTLRIWLKPFRDKEGRVELSEGQMWQMLSDQTSWGSFAERMQELAQNNQRPGGQRVLRKDAEGNEREYYLYEIDATVYPTRSGKIDASDVQIVVNYPVSVGQSRDPFAGFFDDSPFGSPMGGSSMLRQMMEDDFFGSPFGKRLAIKSARPVIADVQVDSTEVLPVPMEGRPDDYRGAVGHYRIITEAESNQVSAGDPIKLQIGIVGDGPMELVQAPPLSEVAAVTDSFKVTDQNLAGFVRDNTKVFVTSIRPKRAGITEIPPIPFSFFDPDSERYETVYSQAIPIQVDEAEILSMDAVVGNAKSQRDQSDLASSDLASMAVPVDFTNDLSMHLLDNDSVGQHSSWIGWVVGLPALVWLLVFTVRLFGRFSKGLPQFRSPHARCVAAITAANDVEAINLAVREFIARRTRQKVSDSSSSLMGALRSKGLHSVASDAESFFNQAQRHQWTSGTQSIETCRRTAMELTQQIENGLQAAKRVKVRVAQPANPSRRRGQFTALILVAVISLAQASQVMASEESNPSLQENASPIELSLVQQQEVLQEANQFYQEAASLGEVDAVDSKELFAKAAQKYQLLMDAGKASTGLYQNAGNAYLQSGSLGFAIACYERGLKLDPSHRQLQANLQFAENRIDRPNAEVAGTPKQGSAAIVSYMENTSAMVGRYLGPSFMFWMIAAGSILFWSLLIVRTLGRRHLALRWGLAVSLLVMLMGIGLWFNSAVSIQEHGGVVVAEQVELRVGDGPAFAAVPSSELREGQRVKVLAHRGGWTKVETHQGKTGWINSKAVEQI